MIHDCNVNNLAKNQVSESGLFHALFAEVCHQIYRALYRDAMFVSFCRAQTWRP